MIKREIILVRVIGSVPPFNVGETAGFDPGIAIQLVATGRATYTDPPPGLDKFGKVIKTAPKKSSKPRKAKARTKAKPKGGA